MLNLLEKASVVNLNLFKQLKKKQMENKYFTPDIEDMSVGCEFEMDDTWGGWKKLTLTKELLANPMVGLGSGNERSPWYHKIRVPYLTKEQIEAEGWKESDVSGFFDKIDDVRDRWYINWIPEQKWLNIGDNECEVDYAGPCKDINTFRKIIKLLKI